MKLPPVQREFMFKMREWNKQGHFPSIDQMGDEEGVCFNTIEGRLRALAKKGLVKRLARRRYWINTKERI